MSSSIPQKPRIQRKERPKGRITRSNYRQRALPALVKDFEERCAYSMQHTHNAGGKEHMEVDHFDPRKKNDYIQIYSNLFLAKRACNNKKQANWPTKAELRQGIRFLNPCKEMDYGVHIFEDPDTHEVWGATPAGRYHIRMTGLNSENLVAERAKRSKLRMFLTKTPLTFKRSPDAFIVQAITALKRELILCIPEIPLKKKPPS